LKERLTPSREQARAFQAIGSLPKLLKHAQRLRALDPTFLWLGA